MSRFGGTFRYTLGGNYSGDNSSINITGAGGARFDTIYDEEDPIRAGPGDHVRPHNGLSNAFIGILSDGQSVTFYSKAASAGGVVLTAANAGILFSINGTNSAAHFVGGNFGDILEGGGGNDVLNGGSGQDLMIGNRGNDLYYVDNIDDTVSDPEAAEYGTKDKVLTSIDLEAPTGIEVLRARSGSKGLSLTGIEGRQKIVGDAGSDRLAGLRGNDELNGKGGQDTFVFNTDLNKDTNVDKLADFSHGTDTIELSRVIFGSLAPDDAGHLAESAFKSHNSGNTVDGSDRIIYVKATGYLYFDQDGSGATYGAIKFAHLDGGATLTAADFLAV